MKFEVLKFNRSLVQIHSLIQVHQGGTGSLARRAGLATGPETAAQWASLQSFDEFANLVISESAEGPFLGESQQQFPSRIPNNRHLDGRLNVVFADMHGETVQLIF